MSERVRLRIVSGLIALAAGALVLFGLDLFVARTAADTLTNLVSLIAGGLLGYLSSEVRRPNSGPAPAQPEAPAED